MINSLNLIASIMAASITPFGYGFFAVFGLAITLAYFVNRRMSKDKGRPNGCLGGAYFGTIVVTISMLFVMSVLMFVSRSYVFATYPKYQATVVDVHSEWVERDVQDDDGFSRTETVEMHTAILEFKDNTGQVIKQSNDIRSGGKPDVGDIITVAYKNGDLNEYSFRSMLMQIALAVMMTLLGFLSTGFTLYAMNKSTQRVQDYGFLFLLGFVLPAAMFAMMCGMLYALWDHYTNAGDMPLWAQGVAIFFSIVLFFTLLACLGNFFSKEEE